MSRRVTYTSRLPEIADRLETRAPEVARDVAERVEAVAHTLVPRDTERLDETLRVVRTGPFTFQVRAGEQRKAFYGFMREFGTVKLPARPFMVPAAESQRGQLQRGLQRLIDG